MFRMERFYCGSRGGVFQNLRYHLLGGPNIQDYIILGSVLGSPYWEITSCSVVRRARPQFLNGAVSAEINSKGVRG